MGPESETNLASVLARLTQAVESLQRRPETPLRSASDAAAYLMISRRKLHDLTSPRGSLPAVRIGGSLRYDVRDLDEYLGGCKEAA